MTKLLFVYGTLKKGHRANHILSDATFVGKAVTVGKFHMLADGFPVLLEPDDKHAFPVAGEVYEVDDKLIPCLDQYENEGQMYHRTKALVIQGDKPTAVLMYVGDTRFWRGHSHMKTTKDFLRKDNVLEWKYDAK